MAAFVGDMHGDAMAAPSVGFHHPVYHPQRAAMYDDGDGMSCDQGYPSQEAMMNGEYNLAANGFYPPPQAPRLTAAAARASSMTAMYYNPTLHPQHAFASNAGGAGPWISPYQPQGFGRPPVDAPSAYQHQHLEHHLMSQNALSKMHQGGYDAASAYGQESLQPGHYQARNSYPDDRQTRPWNAAAALPPPPPPSAWTWKGAPYDRAGAPQPHHGIQEATPTGYNAPDCNSYFAYPKQQQQQQQQQNCHQHPNAGNAGAHSNSQPLPPPHPTRAGQGVWEGGQRGDVWDGQNSAWGPPYPHPEGYQGNWQQEGAVWNPPANASSSLWNGAQSQGAEACRQGQWGAQQPDYQRPTVQVASQAGAPPIAAPVAVNQPNGYGGPVRSEGAMQEAGEAGLGAEEARAAKVEGENGVPSTEKANGGGPAPPSPETLDKSSVPISSVGAEIVWSACAALLEPELVRLYTAGEAKGPSLSSEALRAPSNSPPRSHYPSSTEPEWSADSQHSSTQRSRSSKSQLLQRLAFGAADGAATSSEESSASSSEPGTPPSSFPSYLYDEMHRAGPGHREKVKSMSTMQGVQGLGLSPSEATVGIARQTDSLRRYVYNHLSATPSLQRRGSQSRDAVAGVFTLLSPAWRWSANEDKLESLSNSLREAAKVNPAEGQKATATTFSAMKRSSSLQTNRGTSQEANLLHGAAAPGSETSPAFRRFAHQVLAQTLVSPTAFMLAMMYSLRVPLLAVQTIDGVAQLDPEAIEIFAQPPSAAPFKLFTLGLMIANKHLDDNTFLNKTWNEVTGISLVELNRMERWFLEKSSYEVTVPEETWVAFLERLAARTEGKLESCHGDAKRVRVATKHRSAPIGSTSFGPSTAKRAVGGGCNEEALKRLLLSIEEALVVVGRIAPFELSEAIGAPSRPRASYHSSASPEPTSHRPNASLQHLHQQSRSAPALPLRAATQNDCEIDIFGEEDGPYRPHNASIRTTMMQHQKAKYEPGFNRSISEDSAPLNWQQERAKESEIGDAPLAPSVLLDLLNRGQHYAHSAQ